MNESVELPRSGGGPLNFQNQQAAIAALANGQPAPIGAVVKPSMQTTDALIPQPVQPPTRSYIAELTYRPHVENLSDGSKAIGFNWKFPISTYDETDNYITICFDPNLSISLTGLVENLSLKIGDKTWPVSWIGQAFTLRAHNLSGISFMRCVNPKPTA